MMSFLVRNRVLFFSECVSYWECESGKFSSEICDRWTFFSLHFGPTPHTTREALTLQFSGAERHMNEKPVQKTLIDPPRVDDPERRPSSRDGDVAAHPWPTTAIGERSLSQSTLGHDLQARIFNTFQKLYPMPQSNL